MASNKISIAIKFDPFINRMAHHSVAMPEFRKQMAVMMKDGKAFVFASLRDTVTVHPSDELLDAFYSGMGLK